jgi:uncharacterized protein (DUF1810 family)
VEKGPFDNAQDRRSLEAIFGELDAMKFRSSVEIFEAADRESRTGPGPG